MPVTAAHTDKNGIAHAWMPFATKTRNPDGTLRVFGKITGPGVDNSLQRMDPAWLEKAVPEWFEPVPGQAGAGNIREMHTASAVGKAVELVRDGDDYFIAADIVDEAAIKKVEHDVYQGFSIGIKKPQLRMGDQLAPNGVYVGGRIIETSLADRPDLNDCVLVAKAETADGPLVPNEEIVGKADASMKSKPHVFKPSEDDPKVCAVCGQTDSKGMHSDPKGTPAGQIGKSELTDVGKAALAFAEALKISDDARDAAGDAGQAVDLGQDHPSYPVRNVAELKKAIQAYGRSDPADRDKLQSFLKDRASALGATDLIPDSWDSANKAAGDPAQAHAASAAQVLKGLADLFIQEAQEMADGDDEMPSLQALLDCYGALKWWLCTEALEGEAVEGDGIPEVMGGMGTEVDVVVGLAEKPDVGKAGARHSAADQQAIQAAHDATVKAGAVCTKDGADDNGDGTSNANDAANKLSTPDATKVSEQLAEAVATIKSMRGDYEALKAQVTEMGTLAAPSNVRRTGAVQQTAQKTAQVDALKAKIAEATKASQGVDRTLAEGYGGLIKGWTAELAALETKE